MGEVIPIVDTSGTDREAVHLSGLRIERTFKFAFREQPTSDYGIDAHVEIKRAAIATGRLVGLQIKGGDSYFKEENSDGWKYRPSKRHVSYWLEHSLPVFLLLADLTTDEIYWQEISERTIESGPRDGLFILVPRANTLDSAGTAWEAAADRFADTAYEQFEDNLSRLPPQVTDRLRGAAEEMRESAALLAAHLAHGRRAPRAVLETLLDSDPPWLAAFGPSRGLLSMADYAHAHEINDLSADIFVKAAELDAKNACRYITNGGLVLLDSNHDRAQNLFRRAVAISKEVTDPRLAVGLAILEHPANSAKPVSLASDVEALLEASNDDSVVLSFLARRKEFGRDLNGAVSIAERAQILAPKSAGVAEMLADILIQRAMSNCSVPGDLKRSLSLAQAAVDQIHEWNGPTKSALTTLLKCLMAAGDFADVLNRSLASPQGRATEIESQRSDVQAAAAIAAAALGKLDLAVRLIDEMPDGIDKKVATVRIHTTEHSEDEQRQRLTALFPDLDADRPDALLRIVLRLSDLGVDESDRLTPLVERDIITASWQQIIATNAAAVVDLDANLPALRILADTEEFAATKLVELLARGNRGDDAQNAADRAYGRYRSVGFAGRRCELLRSLNRGDEAAIVAGDVLSSSTVDPFNRRIARRTIARHSIDTAHATNGEAASSLLRRAERQILECISDGDGLTIDPQDVWQLAEVQHNLGSFTKAYATISSYDPPIRNIDEAHLWFAIVSRQVALPPTAFARMLDLAEQFADNAGFSASLLGTVITRTRDTGDEPATQTDHRPELDNDLRHTAFDALQSHIARHGTASPIQVLDAHTTETLISRMADIMRRDDTPLFDILEMLHQARLPLGALASAVSRPYSAILAVRPLGYYLAATAREGDAAAEESAVGSAVGSDVVADASALLIATQLNEYQNVRGMVRNVLVAYSTFDDIVRGRLDLDGRSAGSTFISYDSAGDSIELRQLDLNEHLGALRRMAMLEETASTVQIIADVDPSVLEDFKLPRASPWLTPIALAKARNVPLWSDDVAQRRLAQAYGVPAFGTITHQERRATNWLESRTLSPEDVDEILEQRKDETMRALSARIADVPTDASTVIAQARAEDWHVAVALITVGRPGWWHLAGNPWLDLQAILGSAATESAQVNAWRMQAMWGVARLAGDEPSRMATLLAAVAIMPEHTGTNKYDVISNLRQAQEIASSSKADSPADHLGEAVTTLASAGCLDNASEYLAQVQELLTDAGR
ncbi:DUF4365 domain-containing protein [Rhodococcus fascians]|nr:DUF4365 domain-containing protein [Rhodococcus fascians]MBY4398270.1 DUF4365 domain-containing protein [Rhodococcus fascians]MBY4406867.1 DUF4365 domain-containing protein [Rhodococcus fascians]MBY4423197.1 DUF4365 domain-containing protein [Rhodococcus fascians]MBY4462692.1 DUF4365 domain-containing protein [Rhodococcus fascians]